MFAWLRDLFRDPEVARVNGVFAHMDRLAQKFAETCPICNGTDVFLCPDCLQPIKSHSHENDYMCDCWPKDGDGMDGSVRQGSDRMVDPIRQSDWAVISGHGWPTESVRVK